MVGISRQDYKEVLEKILAGQPVYVKDVGTKVVVTHYSKGKRGRDNDHICHINFEEVPDKKAVDKLDYFSVDLEDHRGHPNKPVVVVNGQNYEVRVSGRVHIKHLRAIPFKGNASRLLYGKKSTNN